MNLKWQWHTFEDFSCKDLYAILALRQEVFVVEQRCAYLDCDSLDQSAWHLVGWRESDDGRKPFGYLRILLPVAGVEMPVIGRLLIHQDLRGQGLGRSLLMCGLRGVETRLPGSPVRISAQYHLVDFYKSFGFKPISEVYDEDGIPHIAMVRQPPQQT